LRGFAGFSGISGGSDAGGGTLPGHRMSRIESKGLTMTVSDGETLDFA
jgi:hypothetical protein